MTNLNAILAKIENIINHSADCYNYEIRTNVWEKGGKNRTYITVIETTDRTKHYKKHDFGYIDNTNNEYCPGKWDANKNFNLGGSSF